MSIPLILIRHPESTKNVVPHFSGVAGDERLTIEGTRQIQTLATYLVEVITRYRATTADVYFSETDRCRVTASSLIAQARLIAVPELAPIRSPFQGMNEEQSAEADPEFARLLRQYRLGLRSAYDIRRGRGEEVEAFERRVATALKSILCATADLSVIVGHRSTLTAILLAAARQLLDYPVRWYGHVIVPLASVSILEHDGARFTAIVDACRVLDDVGAAR